MRTSAPKEGIKGTPPRSLGERCDDITRLIEEALADLERPARHDHAAASIRWAEVEDAALVPDGSDPSWVAQSA